MKPLKILMLEDNAIDASVILKTLSNASFQFECTIISSGKEFISKLNDQDYDVILCDYQLPDFDAVQALKIRNQNRSFIPFILITGAVSEEVAIAVVKEGANDYILKDRLQRLPLAIEKAIKKQQLKFDKQSADTSLSELTERFQLVAKTSFDVIWDFDIERNLVYCSNAIEKIIGINIQQHYEPQYLARFIHPDDLLSLQKSFFHIIRSNENRWRKIFRVVRSNGAVAWVNSNAMIIRDRKERAVRMVGVMHDITEVRRLQHELIDQELQIQKHITQITIQAQEKERTEIGRELHDNVNQLLATAKIMIDTARNIPDMHDLCLSKSQEAIMDAITELRNLAHSMMPPPFEKSDFESIVRDLAYKVNLAGNINLKLDLPDPEKMTAVNNQVKLTFYRIIQEQITNILKYAKAKNVCIKFDLEDDFFNLIIADDGVGFDTQKISAGIGLKNIESRCSLLNGRMDLIASPGEGCIIKITVPAKNAVYV